MSNRVVGIAVHGGSPLSKRNASLLHWCFTVMGCRAEVCRSIDFEQTAASTLSASKPALMLVYFADEDSFVSCQQGLVSHCPQNSTALLLDGVLGDPRCPFLHLALTPEGSDTSLCLAFLHAVLAVSSEWSTNDGSPTLRRPRTGKVLVQRMKQLDVSQIDNKKNGKETAPPASTSKGSYFEAISAPSNEGILDQVWDSTGTMADIRSTFDVAMTVPQGTFEEASIEGKSVGALVRRMCRQNTKVRVLMDAAGKQLLTLTGPTNASASLEETLGRHSQRHNTLIPSPPTLRKADVLEPTRYYAYLPNLDSGKAFARLSGPQQLGDSFRFVGLSFRFEVTSDWGDYLLFEGLLRLRRPDANSKLVVEELTIPSLPPVSVDRPYSKWEQRNAVATSPTNGTAREQWQQQQLPSSPVVVQPAVQQTVQQTSSPSPDISVSPAQQYYQQQQPPLASTVVSNAIQSQLNTPTPVATPQSQLQAQQAVTPTATYQQDPFQIHQSSAPVAFQQLQQQPQPQQQLQSQQQPHVPLVSVGGVSPQPTVQSATVPATVQPVTAVPASPVAVAVPASPIAAPAPEARSQQQAARDREMQMVLAKMEAMEADHATFKAQATRAMLQLEGQLGDMRERAADSKLVENAIHSVQQSVADQPSTEIECRRVESKLAGLLEQVVVDVRRQQKQLDAVTARVDGFARDQEQNIIVLQQLDERLQAIGDPGLLLTSRDPMIVESFERQTAAQIAINEMHAQLRGVTGQLNTLDSKVQQAFRQLDSTILGHEETLKRQRDQIRASGEEQTAREDKLRKSQQEQLQTVQQELQSQLVYLNQRLAQQQQQQQLHQQEVSSKPATMQQPPVNEQVLLEKCQFQMEQHEVQKEAKLRNELILFREQLLEEVFQQLAAQRQRTPSPPPAPMANPLPPLAPRTESSGRIPSAAAAPPAQTAPPPGVAPAPTAPVTAGPVVDEESRAQLLVLKESVKSLQTSLMSFDPDLMTRSNEKLAADVKELKRRLNEVELAQANLEGLAAEEEERGAKFSDLTNRVDSLETKVSVLESTGSGEAAEPLEADQSF